MNQKISRLLQPNLYLYIICLVAFAIASVFFSLPLAVAEGAIVIAVALYDRRNRVRRKNEITQFFNNINGNVEVASKDTMVNAPLPMAIFRPESGDIIWTNDRFLQLTEERDYIFDAKLSAIAPGFDSRWLLEGKNQSPVEVSLGERRFLVYGHMVRTGDRGTMGFLATTYWVDVTEYSSIKERYLTTRPVAAVLMIDNYEELMNNLTENERSVILSELDSYMDTWLKGTGCLLRKYERERYLLLFEERYLQDFIDKKFEIIDMAHQVKNPRGIPASLSIGIGQDGENFGELLQFANLSIEMALSRGGDQAVVRNKFTFEFYGGRSKEMEKRTKVKSRVMANALSALLSDASYVFIMGHKMPDNDVLGAAAGIYAAARKRGVGVYIIREPVTTPAQPLYDRLAATPEYRGAFLPAQEALLMADSRSLVVVVDTNRPEQVQARELLESCNRVAVIDHHRRAATYIEGAVLNYHEPYASSAAELVTELLQYILEPADLIQAEAEALLAGIVLDTKNFTIRTGGRTFEAAAFLRRAGADTAEVKKIFQNDLKETICKYTIIQNAQRYRENIAVAAAEGSANRIIVAQAADELLNIIGIDASFVLAPDVNGQINISGRSMGETNVQVILEKLGGGGNAAVAGGQVSGKSLDEVKAELERAIDSYLDD